MKESFIQSIFGRRVLIVVAMAGLLGLFLALYYFVYAPEQQVQFNRTAFRVLQNITDNFRVRVDNYSTALVTSEIRKRYTQNLSIPVTTKSVSKRDLDSLRSPLPGDINKDSLYSKGKRLSGDTIRFLVKSNDSPVLDTSKLIREILDPIDSIRKTFFESILLFTCHIDRPDTLLYQSGNLSPDRQVFTDSLYGKSGAFLFPEIRDAVIEGVDYKVFLLPFRIDTSRYLMSGFMTRKSYKSYSQDFPLIYVVTIGVLIILVLLSLPFL